MKRGRVRTKPSAPQEAPPPDTSATGLENLMTQQQQGTEQMAQRLNQFNGDWSKIKSVSPGPEDS